MLASVRPSVERAILAAQGLRKPLPVFHRSGASPASRLRGEAARVHNGSASLQILALGDIALLPAGQPDGEGWPSLLAPLSQLFGSADLSIANLESVLSTCTTKAGRIGSFLRADPEAVVALTTAGVDVVTCANNHCLDFGPEALVESVSLLEREGISVCGVGSAEERAKPVFLERNGMVVAVLGFCDDFFVDPASRNTTGPAEMKDEAVLAAVSAARERADIVVVNVHWGYEWALHPMRSQRDRARAIASAGAALVLCHHAHVPMAVEMFGDSVIAHGLGNCAFPWKRSVAHPWRNESYALQVSFANGKVATAAAVPIHIRSDHRIAVSSGRKAGVMLGALQRLHARLDDDAWLGSVERSRLNREAAGALRSLISALDQTEATFSERCAWLRTPRQQRLLSHIRGEGGALAPVAGLLERLAREGQSSGELRTEGRALKKENVAQAIAVLQAGESGRVSFMERIP